MRKSTLEEFIQKFRKKFPNKEFTFDESVYVNSHTPMKVKCEHGHCFEIRPCDLMNGYGCNVCGGTKKMTEDDFIREATYVHNGYFSYEKCGFKNVSSMVNVICPIHGIFEVKANNHLNGANCKKCSQEGITHKITLREKKNKSTKKLSLEDFKERLFEKWGNRYVCTENSVYRKTNLPIEILCKEHGPFQITPNHILSGRGCPICGKNKTNTKEQIIERIKKAQPFSDYDFSMVTYRGIHNPITIKCNKCGMVFSNSPGNLIMKKNGCPGCGLTLMEKEIEHMLIKNNIKFEIQKKFDWLIYKDKLRLDFYLPDYNAAIECQGAQHFVDIYFNGQDSSLLENKERDKVKYNLCKEHNIKIYYYANYHMDFPYYVYENKETMLNDIMVKKI